MPHDEEMSWSPGLVFSANSLAQKLHVYCIITNVRPYESHSCNFVDSTPSVKATEIVRSTTSFLCDLDLPFLQLATTWEI